MPASTSRAVSSSGQSAATARFYAARHHQVLVEDDDLVGLGAANALAGLSGAILAQFIGAWSPGSWGTAETFLYFAVVIIGGAGNNFGAMVGAVYTDDLLDRVFSRFCIGK